MKFMRMKKTIISPMKTIIIHHVNEDFTEERIETITMRGGCIVSITYSDYQPL